MRPAGGVHHAQFQSLVGCEPTAGGLDGCGIVRAGSVSFGAALTGWFIFGEVQQSPKRVLDDIVNDVARGIVDPPALRTSGFSSTFACPPGVRRMTLPRNCS